MAKHGRNSGKLRQDSILSQFKRDAQSDISGSAVMQCMQKRQPVQKREEVRVSYKFLSTGV